MRLPGSFATRTLIALALAAAAALAGMLAGPAALAVVLDDEVSAASTLAFRIESTGAEGSELNLGVLADGTLFVGGWDGIARSQDDGASWDLLDMGHFEALGWAADRVLVVDKDTGRVFVSDTNLACTFLSWSDDLGETWASSAVACGGGVTDHQKAAVGPRGDLPDAAGLYPNAVWVCANGLSHTNCAVSPDGGITYLPAAPHGIGCAFQGAPLVDPLGVLYEPTTQCGAQVRFTADHGQSWTEVDIEVQPSDETPDLARDAAGTLYFVFTDSTWKPAYARSFDGGLTWQGPFAIPVPGLRAAALPSTIAGDGGRLAVAFYGTTDNPAGWSGNPGDAPTTVKWHGYVVVLEGAGSPSPVASAARVNPDTDPLQIGCMTKLGRCLVNIADYMDVDVGPDGRVYAVFTDGCQGCTTAANSRADAGVVAVQTGGPLLKAPTGSAAAASSKALPGAGVPMLPEMGLPLLR